MEGWIKLHRKITDHWIFKNSDYFHAWITILLTVNHAENKVLIHNEVIICGRGQSLLSLENWTKKFGKGWSKQRTRTFFELLKKDSMINTEGLQKTTRLTVCNYESYQDEQHTSNTQTTRKQHTSNTQLTPNNNDKKNNNDNNEREEVKTIPHKNSSLNILFSVEKDYWVTLNEEIRKERTQKMIDELKNAFSWKVAVRKVLNFNEAKLESELSMFLMELHSDNEFYKDLNDIKKYFKNRMLNRNKKPEYAAR